MALCYAALSPSVPAWEDDTAKLETRKPCRRISHIAVLAPLRQKQSGQARAASGASGKSRREAESGLWAASPR